MNSSIFNSDLSKRRFQHQSKRAKQWLLSFGFLFLFLIGIIMIINCSFAGKPRVVYENQERQLTAYKIFSPKKYNIIFSGSSRINFGIDPDSMKKYLPGMTIYNCAMFGGAINQEILSFLEQKKIDYASPLPKVVVLELSPRVMWACLRENRNYSFMKKKSPDEIQSILDYSPDRRLSLNVLFMPMSRDRWNNRRKVKATTIPVCHTDTGWYQVINPTGKINNDWKKRRKSIDAAKALWGDLYDTSKSFREILDMTKYWNNRGVIVIGIEPPVFPEVQKIEQEISTYHRTEIITDFEKAGGIFITISGNFIPALGSHLDSDAAKAYSEAVAQELQKLLHKKRSGAISYNAYRKTSVSF